MNYEILADTGCDPECYVGRPHTHLLVTDVTPRTELEAEVDRMARAVYRERVKAGEVRPHLMNTLYALQPAETPFVTTLVHSPEDRAFSWEGM